MPMQAEISFEPFGLNEKKIQYLVLDIKINRNNIIQLGCFIALIVKYSCV